MGLIYCFLDIEVDGPTPGENSVLSLGFAAFDEDKREVGVFETNLDMLEGSCGAENVMSWWRTHPEAWTYFNRVAVATGARAAGWRPGRRRAPLGTVRNAAWRAASVRDRDGTGSCTEDALAQNRRQRADGGTVMDMEPRQFWAEAAQRILGHEVSFAGPKGKATCHCAGASAAPGLRWCEAEWPSRHIRLCTGVGGECRIVRPTSLTETERGSIVTGPDEDSEVAKAGEAGIRKPPAIYLVENDGEVFEIYSSMAKAVSVLPEDKREMAVESLMSTGKWTERGENAFNGVSIERRLVK